MPTQVFYQDKFMKVQYVGIKFSTLARRGDIASKNAVTATAEYTKRRARQLVPYKSGKLHNSGRVEKRGSAGSMTHKGRNVSVVTFGGGGTGVNYAVIQHEGFFHHPGGRVRLYLKIALDETNAQNILAQALKDRIQFITKIQSMEKAVAP